MDIEINPKDKEIEVSESWDLDGLIGKVTSFVKKLFSSSTAEKPTDTPVDGG